MRKFSLVLAAAVMAVGLAGSGSASAFDAFSNGAILTKGEILMKSDDEGRHIFTILHEEHLFACWVRMYGLGMIDIDQEARHISAFFKPPSLGNVSPTVNATTNAATINFI